MSHSLEKNTLVLIRGCVIGIMAALTVVAYRFCLSYAENALFFVLSFIKGHPFYIALWFVALAVMGILVARTVRFESMAGSSGVPQLMGEMKGDFDPCWWRVLLAKFIGGTLCILGGLSLGRSGPSIQIGGMTAKGVSRIRKYTEKEEKDMIFCGAAAGLSATFHAPLAGVIFALEGELWRTQDKSSTAMALISAISADYTAQFFFGKNPIFSFSVTALPLKYWWLFLPMGILLGLAGAGYNAAMLKCQSLFLCWKNLPREVSFGIVFLISGVLGLVLPQVLCGGNAMITLLENGHPALWFMFTLLIVKFTFSIVSSASGVPGGIFFPLLILGAYIGALYGHVAIAAFSLNAEVWPLFILMGMSGLFSGIVRAPVAAIILIVEMADCAGSIPAFAIVSILAYFTANRIGSKPICKALLERMQTANTKSAS
jgi:H+/Cl- antiporter ClcA